MKAKKKTIQNITPDELGVDLSPRLETLKVTEPPKRQGGEGGKKTKYLLDDLSRHVAVSGSKERLGLPAVRAVAFTKHSNSIIRDHALCTTA